MSALSSAGVSDAHKYSHLYNYSGANKAGMEGIDKEKQAQIIYEMSKDSAYFKRAAKLDAETDIKVQALKKTLVNFKGNVELKLRDDVLQHAMELERRRSFDRICCVLDMDMFFAAVEIRDQPHLKDVPVAVGGMSMISTANYVARKYGVRAAMPGFIARKLCPQLVFVRSNFEKYQFISGQIIDVIRCYDPNYSSHTLDEVYFDLTKAALAVWRNRNKRGPQLCDDSNSVSDVTADGTHDNLECQSRHTTELPEPSTLELRSIAVVLLQEIRQRISTVTEGLTCSAGMANNFFLAKICADVNKPDGQYELPPTRQAVIDFVADLPTRKVGGIGKVTERMLDNLLSIKKMGQVRELLPQILHTCTPILYQFLLRSSLGIGSEEGEAAAEGTHSKVKSSEKKAYMRKSLGCERTYSSRGISDPAELYEKLHKICTHVADDMAEEDLWAKSVTLKLKNTEFELITRIATSPVYFNTVESIEALAKGLLDELMPVNVRLMGVQVTKFKGAESAEADPKQKNMLQYLKEKSAVPADQQVGANSRGGPVNTEKRNSDDPSVLATARSTNAGVFQNSTGLSSWLKQQPQQQEHYCDRDHQDIALGQDIVDLSENPEQYSECETGHEEPVDDVAESGVRAGDGGASTKCHSSAASAFSASNTAEKTGAVTTYECPVCGVFVCGSLQQLNVHLDHCLGGGTASTSSTLACAVAGPSTSAHAHGGGNKAVVPKTEKASNSKRPAGNATSSAALPTKKHKAAKAGGNNRSVGAGGNSGGKALNLAVTDYFCRTGGARR